MREVLASPGFLVTYAVVQTALFLLLMRLLDPYEHHPLGGLAIMTLWGAVGATTLATIGNQLVTARLPEDIRLVFGPAIAAPIVEEVAKGLPLVLAFALASWAHKRFGTRPARGLTVGLVFGAAVGLGFAFTEDIQFLLLGAAEGPLDEGLATFVLRRDFFGWGMLHHAIFSAALGAGLGLAMWSPRPLKRIGYPLLGLGAAIALHAVNNGFVELMLVLNHGYDAAAAFLSEGVGNAPAVTQETAVRLMAVFDYLIIVAFVAAVVAWQSFQRRIIRSELEHEADSGLIDGRDLELVPRFWHRTFWYWELFRIGELHRARTMRRYHIELANLAFLRWVGEGQSTGAEELKEARDRVGNMRAATIVDVSAPQARQEG